MAVLVGAALTRHRLDKVVLACARGRCFGQQLNLLLKRLMYIAWACFQNVFSVIASQMFYICALVNCFYLIRIKLLLLYC